MLVDTVIRETKPRPVERHPAARRCLSLTASEFRQLGLYRVAYLTRLENLDGEVSIVIHGADGMAVAAAETVGLAMELADQLGLALVRVH